MNTHDRRTPPLALGLRQNWAQFALLVLVNGRSVS